MEGECVERWGLCFAHLWCSSCPSSPQGSKSQTKHTDGRPHSILMGQTGSNWLHPLGPVTDSCELHFFIRANWTWPWRSFIWCTHPFFQLDLNSRHIMHASYYICQAVLTSSIILHLPSNNQFYTRGNRGTKNLKNVPKATQLVCGRARNQTVVGCRLNPCCTMRSWGIHVSLVISKGPA